jgi:hypothetical protein
MRCLERFDLPPLLQLLMLLLLDFGHELFERFLAVRREWRRGHV